MNPRATPDIPQVYPRYTPRFPKSTPGLPQVNPRRTPGKPWVWPRSTPGIPQKTEGEDATLLKVTRSMTVNCTHVGHTRKSRPLRIRTASAGTPPQLKLCVAQNPVPAAPPNSNPRSERKAPISYDFSSPAFSYADPILYGGTNWFALRRNTCHFCSPTKFADQSQTN